MTPFAAAAVRRIVPPSASILPFWSTRAASG
jgi:hypothetical protein